MENSLGLAHFLADSDGIACVILVLMSIGTWYLIVTKGLRLFAGQRKSDHFLAVFWEADSLDAVAYNALRKSCRSDVGRYAREPLAN